MTRIDFSFILSKIGSQSQLLIMYEKNIQMTLNVMLPFHLISGNLLLLYSIVLKNNIKSKNFS